MKINETFRKFASKIANIAGNPWAFIIALTIIATWALSGPRFGFSNTWQLFINTGTTIVTLLMVFLIQNTQNRDSRAIHIKLDELLKSIKGARNQFVNLEEVPDDVLEELQEEFRKLQADYSQKAQVKKTNKHKKASDFLEQLTNFIEKPLSEK
jgi:low affinity Fe/Cu permease